MQLAWLANTDAGVMVGDYISTSIIPSDGLVLPVFALANLPHGSTLHEATYATPRQVVGSFGGTNPLESGPTYVVPGLKRPIPAPTAQRSDSPINSPSGGTVAVLDRVAGSGSP